MWRVRRFSDLLFRVHLIDAVSRGDRPLRRRPPTPPPCPRSSTACGRRSRPVWRATAGRRRPRGAAGRCRLAAQRGGADGTAACDREPEGWRRQDDGRAEPGRGHGRAGSADAARRPRPAGRRSVSRWPRATRSWPASPSCCPAWPARARRCCPTRLGGLSLLPRGRLDATDVDAFEQEVARDGALDRALLACEGAIDLVVIDTPSGLGRVTTAALSAAQFVLLAFQTESLSLRSLGPGAEGGRARAGHAQPAPAARGHPADAGRARAQRDAGGARRDLERIPRRARDGRAADRGLRARELARQFRSRSSAVRTAARRPAASTCSPTSSKAG